MSLADTLQNTWEAVVHALDHGAEPNISTLAFQFCEAIQNKHPEFGVSYDGLDPNHPSQPNLVVWTKADTPEVLFFGSLVCAPGDRPEPSALATRWEAIIAKSEVDVLVGNEQHCGRFTPMPLSADFEFGLYSIGPSEDAAYSFRSFWAGLTHFQLKRFHFAQHVTTATGTDQRTSYRRPPDPAEYCAEKRLPRVSFQIADGRQIHVHAFVFEPCYARRGTVREDGKPVESTAATQALHKGGMFGVRKIVSLSATYAEVDPPRYPNTVITAWLWSCPLSEGAFCSEMIVEFMAEHKPNVPMEQIFAHALEDLDWEKLAEDATYEKVQWWDDNWFFEAQRPED